ncbi:MAG: polyphosphate polymerase domain-containing protein [Bacteroidota bacterium]|nr:polyphosphate polymerase domain-containing protein [Bacteroidota bacterium]
MKTIQYFAHKFKPISLKEIDGVKLMDRIDTKFMCSSSLIPSLLEIACEFYRILDIDGLRIMNYQTNYYDTDKFSMYLDHQNGKLNRFKIREREYVDSEISFLEVKFKNNKNRTIKSRIKRDVPGTSITMQEKSFLAENSPYPSSSLSFKLSNSFKRITLANRDERITIDFDISFSNICGDYLTMPSVAIIEVKQKAYSPNTPIGQILKWFKIPLSGGSKYCIGVASLYPEVKSNRMKPIFKTLHSLSMQSSPVESKLPDLKLVMS